MIVKYWKWWENAFNFNLGCQKYDLFSPDANRVIPYYRYIRNIKKKVISERTRETPRKKGHRFI